MLNFKEVNLCCVFREVYIRGGYEYVYQKNNWANILSELDFNDNSIPNRHTLDTIKRVYKAKLLAFE